MLDTLVDTPREALAWVAVPTLVIADQEHDRGSVEDRAAALSRSWLQKVPDNHFTALASPNSKTNSPASSATTHQASLMT